MKRKNHLIILMFLSSLIISCNEEDSLPDNTDGIEGKIEKIDGNIIISGSKTFEFENPFENAKYIESYKEKSLGTITNYYEYNSTTGWISRMPLSSSALNSTSGYYEIVDIVGLDNEAERKFKIEANGEYIIEYKKLPQSGVIGATLPQTYIGAGRRVFGPFTLSVSATFTIICADAQQAGFTAQLYYANGNEILDAEYNVLYSNCSSSPIVNNINQIITKTGLTAGDYYINIDANNRANYTVKVE